MMGSFTPPPTTSLTPGDRLDRYELLCILAQGGMGTVWLARMSGKLGFERLVALKTILPNYSNDRQFCDMFLDEARLAARIDHENVARILEIGEDRGLLYYAMELIDGESLRKVYRDVRAANAVFPIGAALRIAADACAGLHATHELCDDDGMPLEVVHRDVSPQNLLITFRGTTKLIDFGVAKARARRSEDTAAGTLKGKIEFMAPEQARALPLDRRADIYSIGAILYELLAGRPVRDVDDGRQLAALHELLTGAPIAPLPAHVPDVVRLVVERALAQDPAHRFANADELRRALEQAMVATGHVASTDDVANLLAIYSRERTSKRKDAIDRALRAAAEGRLNAATIVAPLPSQPFMTPAPYAAPAGLGAMPVPPISSRPSFGTGPSIRTIHGAAITSPPPDGRQSSSRNALLAVGIVGIVALLGVGAGVVVARRAGVTGVRSAAPTPASEGPTSRAPTGVPSAAASQVPPTSPIGTGVPLAGTALPVATASSSASAPVPPPSAVASSVASSNLRGRPKPSAAPPGPRVPTRIGPKQNGEPDDYGF